MICPQCFGRRTVPGDYNSCYTCGGSGRHYSGANCMGCGGSGRSSVRKIELCATCSGMGETFGASAVAGTSTTGSRARHRRASAPNKKFNKYELLALGPVFFAGIGLLDTHTDLEGGWLIAGAAFSALLVVSLWRVLLILGAIAIMIALLAR